MSRKLALIRRMSGEIGSSLARLSPEQWRQPSACDLWQVRDVVAHLTGGAIRQTESMVRGKGGDAAPPAGFSPLDAAAMSASNAQRDIDLRERLGDGLLAAFSERYGQLCGLLESFGSQEWQTLCWHARRGQMTAADYVDLRVQELVIHDWDIRSVLGPSAHLDQEGVALLVDVAPIWLGMSFRPGAKLERPLVFRFEVTGAAARQQDIEVNGETFAPRPVGQHQADVSVQASGEDYLLFMYGRLKPEEGMSSGRLKVSGDPALLKRFEAWFEGL